MDKLTAIRIKYNDGTYSDQIPVGVQAGNVIWDSTHSLTDILGNVDFSNKGNIQQQINRLFVEKFDLDQLTNYVDTQLSEDVTNWLEENITETGSAIIVDASLSIEGAAADAKKVGDYIMSTAEAELLNAIISGDATESQETEIREAVASWLSEHPEAINVDISVVSKPGEVIIDDTLSIADAAADAKATGKLNKRLMDLDGGGDLIPLAKTRPGYYVNNNGGISRDTVVDYGTILYYMMPVIPGEKYRLSVRTDHITGNWLGYAFYASDDTSTFDSTTGRITNSSAGNSQEDGFYIKNIDITVPENDYYMIFSYRAYTNNTVSLINLSSIKVSVDKLETSISQIGDINNLSTKHHDTLVSSVNELADQVLVTLETDNWIINEASFWSDGGWDNPSAVYKIHSSHIPIINHAAVYFGIIGTGTLVSSNGFLRFLAFNQNDELLYTSQGRTVNNEWQLSSTTALIDYPATTYIIIEFSTNDASKAISPSIFVENYKAYMGYTRISNYEDWYDHYIYTSNIKYNTEKIDNIITSLREIPEYWQSYMNTKVATLQQLDGQIGNHGVSFVFITDEHWPSNSKISPALIKYIQNHTSIKTVINGGDILTKHVSKDIALSMLCDFRNAMPKMYTILGNHDLNSNGTNGEDSSLWLSYDEFYGTMNKVFEEEVIFGDELYYYKDFNNIKVRMIFLDTGYDTAIGVSVEQRAWLQQRLYELTQGWTAIVFQHYVWNGASAETEILTMGSAGTGVKAIVDGQIDNMTAHGANFAGIICGHVHRDYSIIAEKGYPIIGTTCDAGGAQSQYDPVNPIRTKGTTAEQAFDVFHIDTVAKTIKITRIGAGIDREFTYTS